VKTLKKAQPPKKHKVACDFFVLFTFFLPLVS
jgi:hypothetical protein